MPFLLLAFILGLFQVLVGQHPLVGISGVGTRREAKLLHAGGGLLAAGVEELLGVVGPASSTPLAPVTTSCIRFRARKLACSSWQRADTSPAVRSAITLPSKAARALNCSGGTR
jgi:hypothetical protein